MRKVIFPTLIVLIFAGVILWVTFNSSKQEVLDPISGPTADSGIVGNVSMGPTCPVEKDPPDPKCADKPYANARLTITSQDGQKYDGETDVDGKFNIQTGPGVYTISIAPINIFPSCADTEVTVTEGKFSNIDISCDTGIR